MRHQLIKNKYDWIFHYVFFQISGLIIINIVLFNAFSNLFINRKCLIWFEKLVEDFLI